MAPILFTAADAAAALSNAGLETDPEFMRICEAVELQLRRYLDRDVIADDRVEICDGRGFNPRLRGCRVFVKEWPINSITKVEYDRRGTFAPEQTSNLSLTSIMTRDNSLIIRDYLIEELPGAVRVTYNGGEATIPADLKDVSMRVLAKVYNEDMDEEMQQENLGAFTYTRFPTLLPPSWLAVLNSYANKVLSL